MGMGGKRQFWNKIILISLKLIINVKKLEYREREAASTGR
jgi:hypothetical protein